MGRDDGRTPTEDDPRSAGRRRSKVLRRLLALLIVVVISADVAAIVVRRNENTPGSASTVVFRDDFSGGTAFHHSDENDRFHVTVQDETLRLQSERHDVYVPVPPEAPDLPRVVQAPDVSVAVDVQASPGDANTWFGVICRFGGFGTDAYVAGVRPDGSWTIDRTSIGAEYVQRILGSGQARAIERPLGADFAAHLRLDCLGRVETSLVLSVNGTVVGTVTDPSGLGPGNVGMAGLSATGLTFDNLVVEEIASRDTGTSVPAG